MVICKRSNCRDNPDFHLGDQRLYSFSHLGVMFNSLHDDAISVDRRIRKLFDATNAVLGRLGRACEEEKTWRTILDRQFFPVLAYGSHLWSFNKESTCHAV